MFRLLIEALSVSPLLCIRLLRAGRKTTESASDELLHGNVAADNGYIVDAAGLERLLAELLDEGSRLWNRKHRVAASAIREYTFYTIPRRSSLGQAALPAVLRASTIRAFLGKIDAAT